MNNTGLLISLLTAIALSVGGCSTKKPNAVFDESALPKARADLRFDVDLCNLRNQNLNSKSESVECWLFAQQRFLMDIRLSRSDLFTAYAARVRMLAFQADNNMITANDFDQRYRQLTSEFDAAVFQIQDAERAKAPENKSE